MPKCTSIQSTWVNRERKTDNRKTAQQTNGKAHTHTYTHTSTHRQQDSPGMCAGKDYGTPVAQLVRLAQLLHSLPPLTH